MALSNTTADTLATTYCSAQGITDAAAINRWKAFAEKIYSSLKTDAVIASGIPVSTTGTAAAQTGATTAPAALT